MSSDPVEPRLYADLASWWPLLSAPEDYAEEAAAYHRTLTAAGIPEGATVLELGSGGGNNASHLKRWYELVLCDRSQSMLEVSRELNPECEHHVGDMRSFDLGRIVSAVFVHDAVEYLTSETELDDLARTVAAHLDSGGVGLIVPDQTAEHFRPSTDHGGHDGAGRALRYLEWTWDPDPSDTTYVMDMVYILREGDTTDVVFDRHELGTFSEATWRRIFGEAGFDVDVDRSAVLTDGEILTQIVLRKR